MGRLVFQLPNSPDLQPTERLWPFLIEPRVNRTWGTIDELSAVVCNRCVALTEPQTTISPGGD